jgi:hypothetical protein
MKRQLLGIALISACGALNAASWTYRGTLDDGGQPANGQYDLRLSLLDESGSKSVTTPITLHAVTVTQGQFAVDVDFGIDLANAPPLRLKTEVAQGGTAFVALGEPSRFDAKAALAGVCWDTEGNAGTNPAINFIGTTDAQPLVLRTRNVQSLRIEPSDTLFSGAPISANVIAGSNVNTVDAGVIGATIAGGGAPPESDPDVLDEGPNRVTFSYSTVGGGAQNLSGNSFPGIVGLGATVSGGVRNTASANFSTIGGGSANVSSSFGSAVGGGATNSASATFSTVGGGSNNVASRTASTVSGGQFNTASGSSSTVGGGLSNCAGGSLSWAGGRRAKARPGSGSGATGSACSGVTTAGTDGDVGTFVWADGQDADFVSTGENQFLIRAEGGFALGMTPYDHNIEMTVRGRNTGGAGQNSDLALIPNNGSNNEGILLSAINGGAGANDVSLRIAHATPSQINERLLLSHTGLVNIRSPVTVGTKLSPALISRRFLSSPYLGCVSWICGELRITKSAALPWVIFIAPSVSAAAEVNTLNVPSAGASNSISPVQSRSTISTDCSPGLSKYCTSLACLNPNFFSTQPLVMPKNSTPGVWV